MKNKKKSTKTYPQCLDRYINLLEQWKDRPFLVGYRGYRRDPWSYRETHSAILGLSRELEKRGVVLGSRVMLAGKPSPEWVVAFFATLHRGAVVIPLNSEASNEFILHIFSKTSPDLIIGDRQYFAQNKSLSQRLLPFSFIRELPKMTHQKTIPPSSRLDDLAEIVFTSGTTSKPKGVMLTHRNILSNLDPIERGIESHRTLVKLFPRIKLLCTVPYSHMFGQITGIFLPILLGSTVYFTDETSPASLVRAIKRNKILTLITVPRIMKLLADHVKNDLKTRGKYALFEKRWEKRQHLPYPIRAFSFLNIHRFMGIHFWSFIVGGASLDSETHEFWRRTVFAVFQGYGLTETAPIVTMFNPFRHNRSSVGVIFPGQEVKVAPDGEILVKGKNVMRGYFGDPDATKQVLHDGWLRTGDIGEVDTQGQVFIRGRKKDMILTSDGHNVYPVDIEGMLNTRQGVRESVVIGKPGPTGESIHAVLLLEEGVDPEKIIQETNIQLMPHQRIRSYTVWEERDFPRTATLKVKKVDVRKKVFEHEELPSGSENLFEGLVAGSVERHQRLTTDLGFDSLDMVEVLCRLEKKYGISLDETLIGPETTVADIEALGSHPQRTVSLPMPRWTRKKLVSIVRGILTNGLILPFFRLIWRVQCSGLDEMRRYEGPRILCANHESDLDPLSILLCLPIRWRKFITPALGLNRFYAYFTQLGKPLDESRDGTVTLQKPSLIKRFAHGLAYYLITLLFQSYPFPQGAAYRPSLEYSGELLDAGFWILIFPEGRVSQIDAIGRFKGGVALLAEKTDVPVFPVGIRGMRYILPQGRIMPRRGKVRVAFGKPLQYSGQGHDQFAAQVEEAVQKLRV